MLHVGLRDSVRPLWMEARCRAEALLIFYALIPRMGVVLLTLQA